MTTATVATDSSDTADSRAQRTKHAPGHRRSKMKQPAPVFIYDSETGGLVPDHTVPVLRSDLIDILDALTDFAIAQDPFWRGKALAVRDRVIAGLPPLP